MFLAVEAYVCEYKYKFIIAKLLILAVVSKGFQYTPCFFT